MSNDSKYATKPYKSVFHGSEGVIVKTSEAHAMVEAFRPLGSAPRYTEYPDLGHEACGRAFFEQDLWP